MWLVVAVAGLVVWVVVVAVMLVSVAMMLAMVVVLVTVKMLVIAVGVVVLVFVGVVVVGGAVLLSSPFLSPLHPSLQLCGYIRTHLLLEALPMSFTSLEKAIKAYHQHMPATAGQPLVLSSLPVGE